MKVKKNATILKPTRAPPAEEPRAKPSKTPPRPTARATVEEPRPKPTRTPVKPTAAASSEPANASPPHPTAPPPKPQRNKKKLPPPSRVPAKDVVKYMIELIQAEKLKGKEAEDAKKLIDESKERLNRPRKAAVHMKLKSKHANNYRAIVA